MKAKDLYSETGEQIGTLPERVCIRPGMYTLSGTLDEAVAFLNGYYSGAAKSSSHSLVWKEINYWNEFTMWACQKLGAGHGGWYPVAAALRKQFPDDNEAFAGLARLLIEYRKENGLW